MRYFLVQQDDFTSLEPSEIFELYAPTLYPHNMVKGEYVQLFGRERSNLHWYRIEHRGYTTYPENDGLEVIHVVSGPLEIEDWGTPDHRLRQIG